MKNIRTAPRGSVAIADTTTWQWQDDAECRFEDIDLFFDPTMQEQAKEVCSWCPVRSECLDYAISRPEKYGTWGGLGEEERDKVRINTRRRQRNLGRAA
ncbi:WhiB family transcriptional regulator [Nocardiopsis eucommiae]|uniref:Transcriptional regulator WhiB n=1 Tax=Nocardiopsis eucommiae TaxID=2831970 RepID=A0A975LCB6_9ACTN|nr:WhiB family transcriptional regulator [Nocardiopsis eucommiae]